MLKKYNIIVSYANSHGELMKDELRYPYIVAENVQDAIINVITYFAKDPEILKRGYILRGVRVE